MKSPNYMTRALAARDPRFARVLGKLGYGVKAETPEPTAPVKAPEGDGAEKPKATRRRTRKGGASE